MIIPPHTAECLTPDEVTQKLVASGYACIRFAQLGEDGLLWHFFKNKTAGFYIDIGAHHPFRYSNTALLYGYLGWSGINVDPDLNAIQALEQARVRDINVCCAIGSRNEETDFFEFNDGAVNTISPTFASGAGKRHSTRGTRKVPVLTLGALICKYLPEGQSVDYMNIDAEGLDFDILAGNDWNHCRPRLITIEDHQFDMLNGAKSETCKLLRALGYKLAAHVLVTSFYERVG